MPTTLTEAAVERSTYAIAVSFYDEAGKAVEPNAGLTWTLSTSSGVIVNSREKVAIESAETVTIVLHGEDLPARTDRSLVLTIEGTYNSDLGDNLEIKDQVTFTVKPLVAVNAAK